MGDPKEVAAICAELNDVAQRVCATYLDRSARKPGDTVYGKAAALMTAQAEQIARAKEALEPFAGIADVGKEGGRFIIAKAIYSDMGGGQRSAPRQSHWHWEDFERARRLLDDMERAGS